MYFIYCLHTRRTVKENLTIQQAFNELKHCAGFGIANELTNNVTAYNPMGTFRLPNRFADKSTPKINKSYWF